MLLSCPPGFHMTARELQTCTFERPSASKTPPKFHEKTPREERKERILRREREKRAKFWAVHPSAPIFGPPTLRAHSSGLHFFWVRAPTPPGPHQKQNWPNAVWPNSVNKNWPNSAQLRMAKCGQIRMAKSGLAKFGRGQWNQQYSW